ncbi:DUF5683 domain-containing protein [Flexithrix dorotheae]|uniref:DUF5683 domain-containing protein n=1 Tax=Flexithrix dorotheae TaxID=70993 RepID=UPI0012FBC171|nr:DUF5683 domain-containing protein [Flexithrix dorotheae]
MFATKISVYFFRCCKLKIVILLGFYLFFGVGMALAQEETDSATVVFDSTTTVLDSLDLSFLDQKKELNPPSKAALMGATIPGLGQIYNKKYWKVPIVYGGFVIFASLIDFNNVRYLAYRDALANRTDSDSSNDNDFDDFIPTSRTTDQLRQGRDLFRRNRDFNVILTFLWYGLTIADATVDSHLAAFNVSDDLAAIVKPSLIDTQLNAVVPGVTLTLNLK